MDQSVMERIKALQKTDVMNKEQREAVKNEIISIIKNSSVEDVREMLGNKAKVHAIVIQKGGVGKSTTSSDICYTLASMGYDVLGIDSDPQASFSMLSNVDTEDDSMYGLQDVYYAHFDAMANGNMAGFSAKDIEKAIIRPTFRKPARTENNRWEEKEFEFGYDLIPANIDLASCDFQLGKKGYIYSLYMIMNTLLKSRHYDFVIIDCLPGLNAISYAAITAAYSGGCIVPINLEPMTVKGAKNLIESTSEIQHLLWENSKILHKGILGIIKNQYSPRLTVQREYDEVVKELFPISTFSNTIPNKSVCDKAHALGRAFAEYDKKTGDIIKEICYEIIAEDVRRDAETEPLYVDEFGEEVWEKYN